MRYLVKQLAVMLLIVSLLSQGISLSAEPQIQDSVWAETAALLCEKIALPAFGSVGGEWTVLGLARGGYSVPEGYFDAYYQGIEAYVRECGGVLHPRKYTEYSRLVLALTAIGKDPRSVGGYNLLLPLANYDKTILQGINGAVFALLAFDCGGYDIPINASAKTQATRELYLQKILSSQLPDGGFSLGGTSADPDVTGMALQAIVKYSDREDVRLAAEKAFSCMSGMQQEDGGFLNDGIANAESTVQMALALTEWNLPQNDARFVKNGNTIVDALLMLYQKGEGFYHAKGDETVDLMTTEQCFYALTALKRQREGKLSLYRMTDVAVTAADKRETAHKGLAGKDAAVRVMPVTFPGTTFPDIQLHASRKAVEALAARGIINGKNGLYVPDDTMTRAEFAAIIVRGLGLEQIQIDRFEDVALTDWFYGYVGSAAQFGIIRGISEILFCPANTITREEAAVMTARAAVLAGLTVLPEEAETEQVLSALSDGGTVSTWAKTSLAFCMKQSILPQTGAIRPKEPITRGEIAELLYHLLLQAELL